MSKSLKNFITIDEALREFSARQLRLLFCLSAWSLPITFNQQSRAEMVQKEATLKNFFLTVQVLSQRMHWHLQAVVSVLFAPHSSNNLECGERNEIHVV
jgi:cysteinyl-tRNA synthetase